MSSYFMKRIFVFCVLALAVTACHKDKVESTPHLTFKSFNTDVVAYNGTFNATLEFTDQEGDLDSVFITRQRVNQKSPTYLDFYYHSTPQNVSQNKGELGINFLNVNSLCRNTTKTRNYLFA